MSDKPQLDIEAVRRMTADEIVAARKEGLLDEIMYGPPATPEPTEPEPEAEPEGATPGGADQGAMGGPPSGTRAWLKWLGPDSVVRLRREGKLDSILRGEQGHE